MKDNENNIETTSPIKCGHCGNFVRCEIRSAYYQGETYGWSYDDTGIDMDEFFRGYVFELLHCPTCDGVLLSKHYLDEGRKQSEREVLYPSTLKIPSGLPENIKKSYSSSLKVKNIDANAFGVLVGRTLEMVCNDRQAEGKYLGQKLANLAKKEEIPEKLIEVANNLRDLRNIGAHSSLGELTEEEVPVLDNLCRAILEYVYGAPFLVNQARERLEELRKRGNT